MSDRLLDELKATCFVSQVILTRLVLEVALKKDDPVQWSRQFISTVHESVDGNEQRGRDAAQHSDQSTVHEYARHLVDVIGGDLGSLIHVQRKPK